MDDRRGLWRASGHTFLFGLGSVAIALGTTIVLSRLLGPAGKGGYDLVVATVALWVTVFGFSLPAGVTYAVARGLAAPRTLASALIAIGAAQGLIAGIATALLRATPFGRALIPEGFGPTLPVAVGLLVATGLWALYGRAILLGRQEIQEANRRELAARIVSAAVVVSVAIAVAGPDAIHAGETIVWAALAGSVVALAPYLLPLVRTLGPAGARGIETVVRFAAPSAAANVIQFLNYRLDLFLVGLFLDTTAVGLYALAGLVAQLVWLLSNSAATVLLPRVAAGADEDETATDAALVARVVFAVSVVAVGLIAVSASWLVPLVFGARFDGAVLAILWLLPGIAIFAPVNVIGSFMAGIGQPRLNLAVSASSFVVTLVLDLALIPAFGIAGAAIASSCSYAVAAVVMFFLFWRRTGIGPLGVLAMTKGDGREISLAVRNP